MTVKPYFKRPPIHYARTPGASWDMPSLCHSYNYPTGLGQRAVRIAIGELGGGYVEKNTLTAFSTWSLIAPSIKTIFGTNSPGQDADGEVELDIQVAAAAAAYCTGVSPVIGMFFGTNTDQGFYDAWKAMIDWQPDAISWSWGGPEQSWSTQALQQFAALQQTAKCPQFAAAGDNDSNDGTSSVAVDFPASSPFVIGCGGILQSPGSGPVTWKVWNDGANEGTGGGYSAVFPTQSFQVGVPGNTSGRMVPDLAAVASPRTGYNIFIAAQGGWQVIGGTSAVAPLMAGLFGAYQVEFEKRGLPSFGFITDRLFRHPASFWDITQGDNGRWNAQSGPDPCTGLGVPDGGKLLVSLMGNLPGPTPPPNPIPVPPPPTPSPTLDWRYGVISSLAHAMKLPVSSPPSADAKMGIG